MKVRQVSLRFVHTLRQWAPRALSFIAYADAILSILLY